jgi:phage tail-like protein
MRGLIPGLGTPHPFGPLLPALFQEDDFVLRWCRGLDEVLAPVLSTLDCLDAYFDPALTPPDFLDWLAVWVNLSLDQNWPEERRRRLVYRAAELYRWQGTRRGIAEHVALYSGELPEIDDSGGAGWSAAPGGPLPGRAGGEIVVRVRPPPGHPVDWHHLEAIVATAKPAHIAHRIEVLNG